MVSYTNRKYRLVARKLKQKVSKILTEIMIIHKQKLESIAGM